MFAVYGLYGHIQRNTLKSAALLGGFVALIGIFWYAWCAVYALLFWRSPGLAADAGIEAKIQAALAHALDMAVDRWWVPLVIAIAWFVVASALWLVLIRFATGARSVSGAVEPKLHAMVERLAITAGIPKPSIEIIPSSALNAFAAGLGPRYSVIGVTQGLLHALDDDELETVLAHEITHIRNRDIRLVVIAGVFAGGLTLLGGLLAALFGRTTSEDGATGLLEHLIPLPSGDDDSDFTLPARIFILVVLCMSGLICVIGLVVLVHMFALMTQFAISRSREFMADAGAIELTQNPDALISALGKIDGHDRVPLASASLSAMLFSVDPDTLFSTHPSIQERIEAITAYAGGRVHMPRRPKKKKGRTFFIPARGTW